MWDLYGKLTQQPVSEILGVYRDKMPTYASSMTKATVGEFVEEEFIHIDAQGFAHLPKGPGLGMKIDWEFVKRYAVAEL